VDPRTHGIILPDLDMHRGPLGLPSRIRPYVFDIKIWLDFCNLYFHSSGLTCHLNFNSLYLLRPVLVGYRIRIQSRIGIKTKSRFRIDIKTLSIHSARYRYLRKVDQEDLKTRSGHELVHIFSGFRYYDTCNLASECRKRYKKTDISAS
jgi:hypothetical protein